MSFVSEGGHGDSHDHCHDMTTMFEKMFTVNVHNNDEIDGDNSQENYDVEKNDDANAERGSGVFTMSMTAQTLFKQNVREAARSYMKPERQLRECFK